jgi:hypothetical protein
LPAVLTLAPFKGSLKPADSEGYFSIAVKTKIFIAKKRKPAAIKIAAN